MTTIISYPKSGRTWLKYVLKLAGIPFRASHAGAGTSGYRAGCHFRDLVFNAAEYGSGQIIFLHRDPLDTLVSNFAQMHRREIPFHSYWRTARMKLMGRYPPANIDAFAMSARYGVEKICRFNLEWTAELSARPGLLFLSYERLRTNPTTELARLLEFAAPKGSEAFDVNEIVRLSSFENMQKMERSGGDPAIALTAGNLADPESFKVRRGEVGGYTKALRPETIEQAHEIMARLSYREKMQPFA